MRSLRATVLVLALSAAVGGCSNSQITEEELAQAKRDAFAAGKKAGYAKGALQAERQPGREPSPATLAEARRAGFERGVDYVTADLEVEPGQDYAVAFAQGERGFFVRDWLPMKPGLAYECPPQSPYCTVSESGSATPAATAEPAPEDPCEPSYPNVCLDPGVADYDCAGSGEDGPEYVEGPIRILGGDPYDLDGQPRNGVGCDQR